MGDHDQRLAAVKAKLYALPPEEFVAARNAEAKQATGALARAVRALRRPTLSAWLLNLLAAHRPDDLHDLLAIGDQMRDAQRDLRGTRLRELSERRQEIITALLSAARELAAGYGKQIRDDTAWEAETTLRAALAEPDIAERVRTGTLVKAADYNGIGLLPADLPADQGAGQQAPDATLEPVETTSERRAKLRVIPGGRSSEPEPARRATATKAPPATGKAAQRQSAAAREAAQRALETAEGQLAEATAAENEATRRLDEIAAALEELRDRERRLRTEQGEAERDRRRAFRRRTASERAVADARRRLRPLS